MQFRFGMHHIAYGAIRSVGAYVVQVHGRGHNTADGRRTDLPSVPDAISPGAGSSQRRQTAKESESKYDVHLLRVYDDSLQTL